MARKEATLTGFTFTQQLKPEYFGIENEDFNNAIKNKDLAFITEYLLDLLRKKDWEMDSAYSIIHDKDVNKVWSEADKSEIYENKAEHIHLLVKFKDGKNANATISNIAIAFGCEPAKIEKPKPGRYTFDNLLAYLTHIKYADKHQYEPEEVYTAKIEGIKPYEAIYAENEDKWRSARYIKENETLKYTIDAIERDIINGKITRSQVFLTDELIKMYSKYTKRLDNAFRIYSERKVYQAMQAFENNEYKLNVYYIYGQPGLGKTRFVTNLVRGLQKQVEKEFGQHWEVFNSASTNSMDKYAGQEIVVMNDIRGQAMNASDWLLLLDNYNINDASARYNNKMVCARTIFITSPLSPFEFFYYTKGVGRGDAQTESMDQFIRRLTGLLNILEIEYKDNPLSTFSDLPTYSDLLVEQGIVVYNSNVPQNLSDFGNKVEVFEHIKNVDFKNDDDLTAKFDYYIPRRPENNVHKFGDLPALIKDEFGETKRLNTKYVFEKKACGTLCEYNNEKMIDFIIKDVIKNTYPETTIIDEI